MNTLLSFELLLSRLVMIKDIGLEFANAIFSILAYEVRFDLITGNPTDKLALLDVMFGGGIAIFITIRLLAWITEQVLPG